MRVDPLLRAHANVARRALGPKATQAEVLWRAVVSYLFATGMLASSNVSSAIH